MDKSGSFFSLIFLCGLLCLIKIISYESNLNRGSTEFLYSTYFRSVRRTGHIDNSLDSHEFASIGNSLSMIASRCTDNSSFFLLRRELRDSIERSSYLVRTYLIFIFALPKYSTLSVRYEILKRCEWSISYAMFSEN